MSFNHHPNHPSLSTSLTYTHIHPVVTVNMKAQEETKQKKRTRFPPSGSSLPLPFPTCVSFVSGFPPLTLYLLIFIFISCVCHLSTFSFNLIIFNFLRVLPVFFQCWFCINSRRREQKIVIFRKQQSPVGGGSGRWGEYMMFDFDHCLIISYNEDWSRKTWFPFKSNIGLGYTFFSSYSW